MLACKGSRAEKEMVEGEVRHLLAAFNRKTSLLYDKLHLFLTPTSMNLLDESTCNGEDLGSIPRSGRSPGEGNGNPLLYSCLGNTLDRGAWWATVHGAAKNQTRLSSFHFATSVD